MFLSNTPEIVEDFKKQLSAKNWEGVRQAAHKIKPSLNYIGMKAANQLAAEIEENAKEKTELELVPAKVENLYKMCKVAFSELENELKLSNSIK